MINIDNILANENNLDVEEIVVNEDYSKIIIKFNKRISTIGKHSALNLKNYKINKLNDNKTIIGKYNFINRGIPIKDNLWVRYSIPTSIKGDLSKNINSYSISIGYSFLNGDRYVSSIDGDLLSTTKTIIKVLGLYDISNTSNELNIVSDRKVLFKYSGDETLERIVYKDFKFIKLGSDGRQEIIDPISAKIVEEKNILFTFKPLTFSEEDRNLQLYNINNSCFSLDSFGQPLKLCSTNPNITVRNNIPATVKAISLVRNADDQENIYLVYAFTKPIRYFSRSDFKINSLYNVVLNKSEGNEIRDYMYKIGYNSNRNILENDLLVTTINNPATIDADGNHINRIILGVKPKSIKATEIDWVYQPESNNINKGLIIFRFSREVDPASIISDLSILTKDKFGPWDGSKVTINKEILISEISENQMLISFENINIGSIGLEFIESVENIPAILSNNFTIEKINNEIVIIIHEKETGLIKKLQGAVAVWSLADNIITADGNYVIDNSYRPSKML